MSILFGNIFAVSSHQLWQMLVLAVIVLLVLAFVSRPLIFSSLDPVVAAAKNTPLRGLSVVFFLLLAITVTMACQVVGVLLVFVLLIIPGAIGMQWGESIYRIMALSIISANLAVIIALMISYQYNLPASFCITMLLCVVYFVGALYRWLRA
jgi:zinc/manganese transport system permease protein